jgi:hypothetical protein
VLFLAFGSEKINHWKRERKSEAVEIWKSPKSGDYPHSHRTTTTDISTLQRYRHLNFAATESVGAKQ